MAEFVLLMSLVVVGFAIAADFENCTGFGIAMKSRFGKGEPCFEPNFGVRQLFGFGSFHSEFEWLQLAKSCPFAKGLL